MSINTKSFIERCLVIKDKKAEVIPFVLNTPQMKLYDAIKAQAVAGKPKRVIVLKARQMGFSTVTAAIIFKESVSWENVSSAFVAHKDEATSNLFEMNKRFLNNMPEKIKPTTKASNAKELIFATKDGGGLNSRLKCFTAGGESIGRSDTLQNLHVSEFAFWTGDKKATLNGLMQAVPNTPNTLVVIESTANGFDYFKDLWDMACEGKNDFTPIFCAWYELPEYKMPYHDEVLTEKEIEIKGLYNLSNEQIMWRRWCIANNCGGDENLFKQEYPSNPNEAFLTSGDCLFDKEAVANQIERVKNKQGVVGEFTYKKSINNLGKVMADIEFVKRENGLITIHEMPLTKEHAGATLKEQYTLGGDTSGLGTDYFTAKVVSNVDGRTMATLRKQRMDEDVYADQVYCLAKMYHDALLAIETNHSRAPIRELEELRYPNIYMRERVDTTTREISKVAGFETTSKTKPVIISGLITLMRENPSNECDVATLREMLTFVRKENGRQEAQSGYHDDLVMAKAIANFVATQQGDKEWIKSVPTPKYRNATEKFFADNDNEDKGGLLEW